MYLINSLSLQLAQSIFINVGRYRAAQGLSGTKDGTNFVFTTPGQEKFVHNLPFFDISLYLNGMRLTLLDDYTVVESGGTGTGFDTIVLTEAPYATDLLIADYLTV